jgi:hypothetical protein
MISDLAQNVSAPPPPVTESRATGLTPRERHEAEYAALVKHARRVIEVGIPTRDGIVLAADVYLPNAAQLPAPAIVCVNTGYDKSGELRLVSPITGRPEPHHSDFGFPHRESVLYQDNGLPGPYGDGPDSLNRFGSYATLDKPRVAHQTIHHGRNTPSRIVLPVTRGSLPS